MKPRYCEMCDEWFPKAECPKCGMPTRLAEPTKPLRTLEGAPALTHFVQWDRLHRNRKSVAECGEYVDWREISNDPTCPECRTEIGKTAEEMFGSEPATPVESAFCRTLDRREAEEAKRGVRR